MTKKEGTTPEAKTEEQTVVDINGTSSASSSNRKVYLKYSLLMTVFIVSLLVSIYTISPYSKITEVNVEGTSEVYDQVVFESSQITPGDSLIETVISKNRIENTIEDSNVQVRAAELNVSGLQSITLSVEEYQTVAFLLEEGSYRKILENGEILDESFPRITDNQPILIGFNKGSALNRMLAEHEEVDDLVREMIAEIEKVENERNEMLVRVSMTDGNEVLASIPSFSERINYYPQMRETVEGEQGLFDLEAGAFFVPFESEEYSEEYEEYDSENDFQETDDDIND
ncbi:hypothetical protein GCM10008929_05530 [Alkalibacterium psychrotolerans]